MITTRKATVTEFVAGWAGGFWNSHREDVLSAVDALADQAVAYADIMDTPGNRKAYADTIHLMIDADELNMVRLDTSLKIAFEIN